MSKQYRCAIYARKSCEDGLEQEFNSLDAQRFAGESYIKSQQLKGWEVVDKRYEDGGYSGGNIERPGLKELFRDIETRRVDLVVVYKVDRLSRSLFDFAGIVKFFDEYNITFVSVTEPLNTENSLGRLMLNVILSFAQFEREIAGDRIRDKIDTSKKKGLWMGGAIPLGYDVKDKKLVINEEEEKTVEYIFESFIELKSIIAVTKKLNTKGYRTKEGEEFKRATVKRILTNATYIGKVRHKDTLYEGQHEGIIDEKLWNKVKEKIKTREYIKAKREPALLKGLIRCYECDTSMKPTHAKKKNREYRYYVCGNHIRGKGCTAKDQTIAAGEIEQVIMKQVTVIMKNDEFIERAIKKGRKIALETLRKIGSSWENIFPIEQQNIMKQVIKTIWLKENGITIEINNGGLKSLVDKYKETNATIEASEENISTFVELKLRKKSGRSMIFEGEVKTRKNDKLLNALVKAHLWKSQIENGEYANARELGRAYNISCSKYISRILRLNFLAPKIKEAILTGKQPPHIRLNDFMGKEFYPLWKKQTEQFLGGVS